MKEKPFKPTKEQMKLFYKIQYYLVGKKNNTEYIARSRAKKKLSTKKELPK